MWNVGRGGRVDAGGEIPLCSVWLQCGNLLLFVWVLQQMMSLEVLRLSEAGCCSCLSVFGLYPQAGEGG